MFVCEGTPGDTKVAEYLFSTDFYLNNPRVLEGFGSPFEMVSFVPYFYAFVLYVFLS